MRKQVIIIVICLILLAVICKRVKAEIPAEAVNCGLNNGGHYVSDGNCTANDYNLIGHFYATVAEKSAAYAADPDQPNGSSWVYRIVNTSIWYCQGKGWPVNNDCVPPWHYWEINYYCYSPLSECPGGGDLWNEPLLDSDGDGLPDDCDPKPNDPNPAIIKKVSAQGETGNETWINFKIKDAGYISFGEFNAEQTEYLYISSSWVDQSWLVENGWCDDYSSEPSEPGESPIGETPIVIPTLENPEDLEDGIGNEGNTTETDYLADIVTNTQNTTNNMQSISDQLHDLHVDNVNAVLEDQQDEIEEEAAAEQEEAEIDNIDDQYDGEYGEADKPEENLLETILDNFVNNSPVQQVIDDTGIDTAGAFCSFDWSYKGNNITFSICEYEPQLEVMGNILIAITALCSLLIVLRRS